MFQHLKNLKCLFKAQLMFEFDFVLKLYKYSSFVVSNVPTHPFVSGIVTVCDEGNRTCWVQIFCMLY